MDVTMAVPLGKAAQAALVALLDEPGDADMLTVAAGGTATRAGVVFSCMSAYSCTFTLTNNLGKIVASVSTQKMPDADAPTAMAAVPMPPEALPNLNAGNATTIGAITSVAINSTADTDATPPRPFDGAHGRASDGTGDKNNIGGLGLGTTGAGAVDDSKVTLTSSLDPNSTDYAADNSGSGSTISAATDEVTENADSVALTGWDHKVLFRDWGDTAGSGDGGFETGALVYSNIEAATEHPFDRKLANRYVNTAAQNMFRLTIRANGGAPGVTTLATSVSINTEAAPAASTQWANMVFDAGSLVPAQDQDLNVNVGETFTGSYFGAPGQFQCISGGPGEESCALARKADGTVGVNDTNASPTVVDSTGRWSFTPAPGAMIAVPDQDYVVFGAWLTTPDAAAGTHRLGVFYNGMDTWTAADNAP